ncbi:MAG: ADP-forming succinate--CoA ligase subunit beta, partial [Nitrospinota bacterium]
MKIHEFQGKDLLRSFGIPVPEGGVAETPEEARAVAERLKGRVVVKAQIHAGGRGKGGGVKLAGSPAEAEEAARRILGMQLVTPQTGPEGQRVKRVLVEEATPIEKELYLGIVIDRAQAAPVVMASEAGGMDIEEVAATTPEKILTEVVDPALGLQPYQARRLAFRLGLPVETVRPASEFFRNLYRAFEANDCSLAEINPLALMRDGRLLALDAKLNFDDNALYRHPAVGELRDLDEEAPLEVEASKHDLNYIKLDGEVGCMVNGAGLAMATMDIVKMAGASPANFLDVGGGASQEMVESAFRILVGDEGVRAVFIN